MLSRAIYKKQRGRRPLAALAIMSIVAGLLVSSGVALAVHDEDFQLDGNCARSTLAAPQPFDWDNFFNSAGAELALPANLPPRASTGTSSPNTNGTYNTSDGSTFATGSKDTLNITPGWQCGYSANVNSKTDISNAYAAEYVDPVLATRSCTSDSSATPTRAMATSVSGSFRTVPSPARRRQRAATSHSPGTTRTATCSSCRSSRTAARSQPSTPTSGSAAPAARSIRTRSLRARAAPLPRAGCHLRAGQHGHHYDPVAHSQQRTAPGIPCACPSCSRPVST